MFKIPFFVLSGQTNIARQCERRSEHKIINRTGRDFLCHLPRLQETRCEHESHDPCPGTLFVSIDILHLDFMLGIIYSIISIHNMVSIQKKLNTNFRDGAKWTGLFCAYCFVLDQIQAQNQIDIFQVVRRVRSCCNRFIVTKVNH